MDFESVDDLLNYTEKIKGKTFREIDSKNLLENPRHKSNKGLLGQIVETGFYKYDLNSNPDADFSSLGVELKVAGLKKLKSGQHRVKERLVLSLINYEEIVKTKYEDSHLLGKNKKILIIWYEYEKNKDRADFLIVDYQLLDLENDNGVIEHDYNLIQEKVRKGKAHELSEGDTSFLGACRKATSSKTKVKQPFSSIPANPRAFDLKVSYMNNIFKNRKKQKSPKYMSVEDYIIKKLKPYIGKTQIDIYEQLSGKKYQNKIPKNINKLISDILIGKDKDLPIIDPIFQKTNYMIKNIPVKGNTPIERMAFKTISLSEFEDDWEDSLWKSYFEEITLLIILYERKNNEKNGYRVLKGVKKISFTEKDLESFEKTYKLIQRTIQTKNINLLPKPKSFDGQLLEVAPKGQKGDKAYENFFSNDKTKVCFMLTKDILKEKLSQ